MALTLEQFWQAESATHEATKVAAQNDLATAQQSLLAAKSALDVNAAAFNKLKTDIASNRAKLSITSVPSDVAALNAVIRDQLISQRALQGTVADNQDAIAWAQAAVGAATNALTRSTTRLNDSTKALENATAAGLQRTSLKAQLLVAPFDTLQADANAAASGAMATDAKDEIDATFPAELQTIAGLRYATRVARAADLDAALTAAENAWGQTMGANGGLAGTAAEQSVVFRHAEQALHTHVQAAGQRYDRALAVLTGLQALKNGTRTPDLLSAQQQTDITASATRTASETSVEAVDAARKDVNTAQRDLDAQILTQIAADVDALPTDATVQSKRDVVTAAQTALIDAGVAVSASGDRTVMDDWQIIGTDNAWQALVDYLDALATLAELEATSPAALVAALDSAEDAYATALAAAAKAERQVDALADVVALRTERAKAFSAALPARLLSAVRGDSY